jgi:hypothetical protein
MSIAISSSNSALSKKITFNYYTTPIYTNYNNSTLLNTRKAGSSTSSYIEIDSYNNNGSSFHLKHDLLENTEQTYIVSKIRIYAPIHKFDGTTYDGEMIIEHKLITTKSTDAPTYTYVCIPLSDNGGDGTDLDILVKYLETVEINSAAPCITKLKLNTIIPKQNAAYYYDTGSKTSLFGETSSKTIQVIVFPTPIKINSTSANYIKYYKNLSFAFSDSYTSGTDGKKYRITNILGAESLDDNNIYVDCDFSGEGKADPEKNIFVLTPEKIKKIFMVSIICVIIIVFMTLVSNFLVDANVFIFREMFKNAGQMKIARTVLYVVVGALVIAAIVMIFLSLKKHEMKMFLKGYYIFCAAMTFLYIVNLRAFGIPPEIKAAEYKITMGAIGVV